MVDFLVSHDCVVMVTHLSLGWEFELARGLWQRLKLLWRFSEQFLLVALSY